MLVPCVPRPFRHFHLKKKCGRNLFCVWPNPKSGKNLWLWLWLYTLFCSSEEPTETNVQGQFKSSLLSNIFIGKGFIAQWKNFPIYIFCLLLILLSLVLSDTTQKCQYIFYWSPVCRIQKPLVNSQLKTSHFSTIIPTCRVAPDYIEYLD